MGRPAIIGPVAHRLMRTLATGAVLWTVGPVASSASRDAGVDTSVAAETGLVADRTTTIQIRADPTQPWERQPDLLERVPSYRRAVILDGDQRWIEAAAAYQKSLIEVGRAAQLDDAPPWEQVAFKIDLERRRSQALAHEGASSERASPRRAGTSGAPRPLDLERGRLLRLKLMSVRAITDAVPSGLAAATLAALRTALYRATPTPTPTTTTTTPAPTPAPGGPFASPNAEHSPDAASSDGGDAEVRLLLCATRAAIGDRPGARWELAHVPRSVRNSESSHALSLATCLAALGYNDQALASLAVGVYRLGPSSRFLPGQTRELQSANDWDSLRHDPRFERIFR